MASTFNVGADGCGYWGYSVTDPLLSRAFPNTRITHDPTRPYDLIVRSHGSKSNTPSFSCPYITWSGEPFRVPHIPGRTPILEINTAHYPDATNNIYFPQLVAEIPHTGRPAEIKPKLWCASYAFTHRVPERESLFRNLRAKEPTCYAFGPSCRTRDNPFELSRGERAQNSEKFSQFGFVVAMENRIVDGYITEKIGHAFNAGTVPIFWGDTATANEFFNPAAFINVQAYSTSEQAADTIINIWKDKQKLQKYLDAPVVVNDTLREYEALRTEYRPWQKLFIDKIRDAFPDVN